MKPLISLFSACTLAATLLIAGPAAAQETETSDEGSDEVVVRAKSVTIEVDEHGRVLVDGERVSDDDGPVILHVEPGNGEVEVESISPNRREVRVRTSPRRQDLSRRHDRVMIRRDNDWPHVAGLMEDFEIEIPDLPDMAPLLERFHVEIGDPMRLSFREHHEVAEQEQEARELARRARDAEGSEKAELEADLRSTVNAIFEKKVELREEAIAELQEKVQEEREELDRRRESRQEMIDRRMRALLGEDDHLEW